MIATALDINNIDRVTAAMQPTVPSHVTGPDWNGEFASPLQGALWMAGTYQIPQIPLNGKAPFFPEWPTKASADPTQIRAWWDQYRGNFGSLAVPGKHFIFETDSPAVRERFKAQGDDFTGRLIIESRQGGHRYYLSAPGIENIAQIRRLLNTRRWGTVRFSRLHPSSHQEAVQSRLQRSAECANNGRDCILGIREEAEERREQRFASNDSRWATKFHTDEYRRELPRPR